MASNLEELRALVRARHSAATKKVSRLRRVVGAELGGTQFDVRRDPSAIKRYNSRQLKSYLNELNTFVSRGTSFVAGSEGAPLQANVWKKYKATVDKFNSIGDRFNAEVGQMIVPGKGITIEARDAKMKADRFTAFGEASNNPFAKKNALPERIESNDALKLMMKAVNQQMTTGYLKKSLEKSREEMRQMFDVIGISEYQEMADKLTDAQFNVFWNKSGIADEISAVYWVYSHQNTDTHSNDVFEAVALEGYEQNVREALQWAVTINPPSPNVGRGSKRPKKPTQKSRRSR